MMILMMQGDLPEDKERAGNTLPTIIIVTFLRISYHDIVQSPYLNSFLRTNLTCTPIHKRHGDHQQPVFDLIRIRLKEDAQKEN